MNCEEVMSLLEPFIDGELLQADQSKLKAHLSRCSECQAELKAMRALRNSIKEAGIIAAPDSLKDNILREISDEAAQENNNNWLGLKALIKPASTHAIAALSSGLVVFVLMSQPFMSNNKQLEIFDAHIRSLASEQLVAVNSNDRHTVKPWFAGKLNFSPNVPNLEKSGFVLLGGRLDELQNKDVAALVYLRRKHKINVFITPLTNDQAVEQAPLWQHNGYNTVFWQNNHFNYAAISDISVLELNEFANAMRVPKSG